MNWDTIEGNWNSVATTTKPSPIVKEYPVALSALTLEHAARQQKLGSDVIRP